jgi:hypothetical protein
LFKSICGGINWGELAYTLSSLHYGFVGLFVFYIAFVIFAVNNIMVGLFCQNAIESAEKDHDVVVAELLLEKQEFAKKLKTICQNELTHNHGTVLTLEEFESSLESDRLKAWFESIDIALEDGWTLFKLIDTDQQGAILIDQFVEGCLHLRGHAKKIDIQQINYDQKRIMKAINNVDSRLREAGLKSHTLGLS